MIKAALRSRAVLWFYLVISTVHITNGVRYFFANEFMSYHSQAVGVPWQELESGIQTLILALMKVAGTGWIVLGVITVILASAAFKTGSLVARWAIPMGTIIFYLGSFAATWGVYQHTGATTPWGQSIVMVGLALLALIIDAPWSLREQDAECTSGTGT